MKPSTRSRNSSRSSGSSKSIMSCSMRWFRDAEHQLDAARKQHGNGRRHRFPEGICPFAGAMELHIETGDGAQAELRKSLIPIHVGERRPASVAIGIKQISAR